jgi:hypothetical protein
MLRQPRLQCALKSFAGILDQMRETVVVGRLRANAEESAPRRPSR